MRASAVTQALVVCRRELTNWSRDRRSLISVLIGSLFGPLIVAFMFNTMANRQRQVEDVKIPVVGMEHAPALVDWLRQQPGIEIVSGPSDPQEAVRTKLEDVVVVIPKDFAEKFSASKPAQIRLVSDSSSQSARPRLQRIRGLFQNYNSQIASLRLISRGISPVVASPLQLEDVEVSSSQQRAAQILSFIPLFIMMAAFTGAMSISTDSTAGERERGSLEALLINPAPRIAIAAGKWLAGTATAMLSVIITAALLYAIFEYIPLQDLGLRFRLGGPQLAGMLAAVLPICPFIVAIQMYLATFAKSFKEAQSYLSLLMMVQMIPGFLATMYPLASKTWMYFVPWVGQQVLLTDVLGGKAPSVLFFVAAAALNLAIAAVAVQGTTALLHREKIIFGR
jgi:sodium transport system permease protein